MADDNFNVLKYVSLEIRRYNDEIIHRKETVNSLKYIHNNILHEIQRSLEEIESNKNCIKTTEAEIANDIELYNGLFSHSSMVYSNSDLIIKVLLANENTTKLAHRIEAHKNYYEGLWLECKNTVENIPKVRKLREMTNTAHTLQNRIEECISERDYLKINIPKKQFELTKLEQKRVIELSKFILKERPELLKTIAKSKKHANKLFIEIEQRKLKEKENVKKRAFNNVKIIQEPKGNSIMFDKDPQTCLTLEKILLKRPLDSTNLTKSRYFLSETFDFLNKSTPEQAERKDGSFVESYMPSFNSIIKINETTMQLKTIKYAPKAKVIDVLENISIDKAEANNIVSNINPNSLKAVDAITASDKVSATTQLGQIINQGYKKRRVTFDVEELQEQPVGDVASNETAYKQSKSGNGQLDTDKDYEIFWNDYLKSRHLYNLPPSLVYSKKSILKNVNDGNVTSKFFPESGDDVVQGIAGYNMKCQEQTERIVKDQMEVDVDKDDSMLIVNDDNVTSKFFFESGERHDDIQGVAGYNMKGQEQIERIVTDQTEVDVDKDDSMLIETETIENIDKQEVFLPPTQFMNASQIQDYQKKRVPFDLIVSQVQTVQDDEAADIQMDKSDNAQPSTSGVNDESYTKICQDYLKTRHLDEHPPFVYSKNVILKNLNEHYVKSKFFSESGKVGFKQSQNNAGVIQEDAGYNVMRQEQNAGRMFAADHMEVDINKVDSTLIKREEDKSKLITGLKPQREQSSNNTFEVSMNTTDCDDADVSQCIDPTLLLSPKPDVPEDNLQQNVQDLSSYGFSKTGFSFFGNSTSTENKPDSGKPEENSGKFNFNFGAGKSGRSGLFNLFR